MTSINGFQPVSAAGAATAGRAGGDAAELARGAIGEIGNRVTAWADALAPGGAASQNGFRPDRDTLARGGDVYGLREIGDAISARFGATPTQSGDLSRALENVARAAMVEAVGLHGAAADVREAGLQAAFDAAGQGADGGGIDAVTDRLNQAADAFRQRSG